MIVPLSLVCTGRLCQAGTSYVGYRSNFGLRKVQKWWVPHHLSLSMNNWATWCMFFSEWIRGTFYRTMEWMHWQFLCRLFALGGCDKQGPHGISVAWEEGCKGTVTPYTYTHPSLLSFFLPFSTKITSHQCTKIFNNTLRMGLATHQISLAPLHWKCRIIYHKPAEDTASPWQVKQDGSQLVSLLLLALSRGSKVRNQPWTCSRRSEQSLSCRRYWNRSSSCYWLATAQYKSVLGSRALLELRLLLVLLTLKDRAPFITHFLSSSSFLLR